MKKNNIKKIYTFIVHIPRNVEVLFIKFYQKFISGAIGKHCIYYPSCSEYVRQAVDKYGIIKGNFLGIKRLIKCNPFSNGGIDYLK